MLAQSTVRVALAIGVFLLPERAIAQNPIPFEPAPTSARSLALARTGIGMADDATASLVNPAALRFLVSGEVTGTLRLQSNDLPATLVGFVGEKTHRDDEVSFAIAYPFRRSAIAAFGRFGVGVGMSMWLPAVEPLPVSGASSAFPGGSVPRAGGLQQAGFAMSVSIRENVALGGAIYVNHVEVDGHTNAAGNTIQTLGSTTGSDSLRLAHQLGSSWSITPRVHVGAVHRRGTTHRLAIQSYRLDPRSPSGVVPLSSWTADFKIPDEAGAGVGIRVTETFRVLADVTRTRYSQLTPGLAALLQTIEPDPSLFEMRDSTELRVGAEYVIPFAARSVALRGGVWREDSHPLTYSGPNAVWRAALTERIGAFVHRTFGVGFSAGRLEFSVGADIANVSRVIMMSGTGRFK